MTKKIVAACLLLVHFGARAQIDSTTALEEIIVTANRIPQKQVNTGKVMTIITRTEIERSGTISLGELLGRQVGITVIGANNAPGANNDIYVRGAGTGNTLILVDGNPAYDVSTIRSTFDINFIPLGQVERIEILKGGHSTLYGSDAVAGVINIITQQQIQKKLSTHLHLSHGSYGTNTMDLMLSGKTGKIRYRAQYLRYNSTGFSAAADSTGLKDFDKDGMKQQMARAEIGSLPEQKWSWKTGTQWTNYRNALDETRFIDADDFTVRNQNLQLFAAVGRKWTKGSINAQYSLNNSTRNYTDDSLDITGFARFIQSDYQGRSSFAEVYGNLELAKGWQVFVGADHRWQNTDQYYLSVSNFGKYETNLAADTAKIQLSSLTASMVYNNKQGFNLETGVRSNFHSLYGRNFTYNFNPSVVIENILKVSYNLYSAFKAPTLYQLYDGFSGDTNLQPETSLTSEISFQLIGSKQFSARATAFTRKIKNGIDYDYANYTYFNNLAQQDQGIELEAGFNSKKLQIAANYTFLKGQVTTTNFVFDTNSWSYKADGDTTYSHLFRIPRRSLNMSMGWQAHTKWYISLSQRIAGKRFEPVFGGSPVEMKHYQTSDLHIQFSPSKQMRFYVGLKNMFNAQYQEVLGYTTRGRNYTVGIRLGY